VSDKELKSALDEIDQSIAVEGMGAARGCRHRATPEKARKITDYKSRHRLG